MLVRRILGALLTLSTLACTRDFRPAGQSVVQTPWVNARLDQVEAGPPGRVRVWLRLAARPGVKLWDAQLAKASSPACVAGAALETLQRDGAPSAQMPLELRTDQELVLEYQDPAQSVWKNQFAILRAGAAVDLSLRAATGQGCVRVPLVGVRAAPSWALVPRLRAAMESSLSVVTPFHDPGDLDPVGSVAIRFGIAASAYRLWLDGHAVLTSKPEERAATAPGLGLGADLSLFRAARWHGLLGAGYRADFYLVRPSDQEPARYRYFLHGPELAPKLLYQLWTEPFVPGLPGGGRIELGLEAPTVLWLGSGKAPSATLFSGLGLGMIGVF